jgi:hypothetical protein
LTFHPSGFIVQRVDVLMAPPERLPTGAPRCRLCTGAMVGRRPKDSDSAVVWRHRDRYLDDNHQALLGDPR